MNTVKTRNWQSKIIADLTENASSGGLHNMPGSGSQNENEDQHLGPKIYTVSDVLCELEQVKRELYNQI